MAGYGVSSCVQKISIVLGDYRHTSARNTATTSIQQQEQRFRRRKKS